MSEMTIYQTQVITPDVTADGKTVVLTFKPEGRLPVSIQVPRAHFERFLENAAAELSRVPLPGNT
jgi:hypothetical protein